MSHSHFVHKCRCGNIVAQCRCAAPDKTVQVTCDECSECRKPETSWRPIDTCPTDTPVLLRYLKKGKSSRTLVSNVAVVTEATARTLYQHVHKSHDPNSKPIYRKHDRPWSDNYTVVKSPYVLWEDHLERLICDTSAKKPVNVPLGWLPIPE